MHTNPRVYQRLHYLYMDLSGSLLSRARIIPAPCASPATSPPSWEVAPPSATPLHMYGSIAIMSPDAHPAELQAALAPRYNTSPQLSPPSKLMAGLEPMIFVPLRAADTVQPCSALFSLTGCAHGYIRCPCLCRENLKPLLPRGMDRFFQNRWLLCSLH